MIFEAAIVAYLGGMFYAGRVIKRTALSAFESVKKRKELFVIEETIEDDTPDIGSIRTEP